MALELANDFRGSAQLEVVFRNTGATNSAFVIGGATGTGSMYNVEITAMAPHGKTCTLLNTTVGVVAGVVVPIVIRLAPGATDAIFIDLKKLICMENRRAVSLDSLLRQGYSIRATMTTTSEANRWGQVQHGWTGTVTSGTFVLQSSTTGVH